MKRIFKYLNQGLENFLIARIDGTGLNVDREKKIIIGRKTEVIITNLTIVQSFALDRLVFWFQYQLKSYPKDFLN